MRKGNGAVPAECNLIKFRAKNPAKGFEHFWVEVSNDNRQKVAMPGRKRINPQRLVEESAAKRREMFQFVPKERSLPPLQTVATGADSACLSPADSRPLTEISNNAGDNIDAVTQGTL